MNPSRAPVILPGPSAVYNAWFVQRRQFRDDNGIESRRSVLLFWSPPASQPPRVEEDAADKTLSRTPPRGDSRAGDRTADAPLAATGRKDSGHASQVDGRRPADQLHSDRRQLVIKDDAGNPKASFFYVAYTKDDVPDITSVPSRSSITAAPARRRLSRTWAWDRGTSCFRPMGTAWDRLRTRSRITRIRSSTRPTWCSSTPSRPATAAPFRRKRRAVLRSRAGRNLVLRFHLSVRHAQ